LPKPDDLFELRLDDASGFKKMVEAFTLVYERVFCGLERLLLLP